MQRINKVNLNSENFSFFSPPKPEEELSQKITIFNSGRVVFSAENSTREVRHIEKQDRKSVV